MLHTGAIYTPAPPPVQPFTARVGGVLAAPKDWAAKCTADGDPRGNNHWSCCVECADYALIEIILANAADSGDKRWKPPLSAITGRYSAQTGFDLTTGQPDPGTDTAADLATWCHDGIKLPELQREIVPKWCTVDPARLDHIDLALSLSPCLVTLNLPADYAAIEDDHDAWQAWRGQPSGEYHRVVLVAPRTFRTWGFDVMVGGVFWEECVVAVDFLAMRDVLPADSMDFDALLADMVALAA